MAAKSERKSIALIEQLRAEPYRFEFFQAVRLLERHAWETASDVEDRANCPIGVDSPAQREVVRFRALPAHAFPAGPISQVVPATTPRGQAGPPEMTVAFMGLIGPSGVLPQHYTSLVIERSHIKNKDYSLRDFLDLFNHRTISLFYRAWEKHRFPFAYERFRIYGSREGDDRFTFCLYSLVGLGTRGLRSRMAVDDEAILYYGGHFAHHPRSAIGMELILADYFRLHVEIQQFTGQWLSLAADDQSRLPGGAYPEGLNHQLGESVIVGERVWDVQGKFRVRLGPLRYHDFKDFLPDGQGLARLGDLARLYVGPEFDFDVQPALLADEVPWCQLSSRSVDAARLGWNTWIRSRDFENDVDDAIFRLDSV